MQHPPRRPLRAGTEGLTGAALAGAGAAAGMLTFVLQEPEAGSALREVDAAGVGLVLLMALPAATCRRAPIASAVAAVTAALVAAGIGYPPTAGWFCALLIAAGAVYLTDRRRAIGLAAFILVGDAVASVAVATTRDQPLGVYTLVANVCVIGVPLLLADLLREQRRLVGVVQDQAARLAELRAADAHEATTRERVRIARDVHDVVGHELSAIAVQAAAGRTLVDGDPVEARATFARIATMARHALRETRIAVRGMRDGEERDEAPGAPPGLGDLETLLDAVRASGVDVRLTGRPPDGALAPAVQAAAFRIVQEALTNVARYARPARAVVAIHVTNGEAFVDVADDGAQRPGTPGEGSGIPGMRERAALVGGRLDAGPSRDGLGWRVSAVLPADSAKAAVAR